MTVTVIVVTEYIRVAIVEQVLIRIAAPIITHHLQVTTMKT
ncbi:MAG: hypothetical protein WCF23_11035 [Candidatus Nitrosopolaris sp.]